MTVSWRPNLARLAAVLVVLAAGAPVPAASAATAAAPKSVVDPASIAALGRMSAYLRSVRTFQVVMATQKDDVDIYGQLITLNGKTTYRVKSPDAFNIYVNEPAKRRQYFYDGKTLTIYDPKTGYYTHFAAPATIRETLDMAAASFGVRVPLDDLFHWDQGDAQTSKLTSGHYVGVATLEGQNADQYAFRQAGVDWQIWIARGDKPVPLRVVIVASDDPARPQFQADLWWKIDPQFAGGTFLFTPPPGARSIPIVTPR